MVLSIGDISAADWGKGIALSILASLIGGASKLVIRKSWLLVHDHDVEPAALAIEAASADALTLDTNSASSNEGSVSDASEDLTRKRRRQRRMAQTLRYFGMIGMAILNPICCVLAMKYASPSILAPFSGLTMVWVILFSNLVVGEKPSNAQKMASGLIIIGEVIVACFGDHTNDVNVTEEDVVRTLFPTRSYQSNAKADNLIAYTLFFFFATAEFIQESILPGIFRRLMLLLGLISVLDQFFSKSHTATVRMGILWWFDDWFAKLFEGFLNTF